LDIDLQSIPKTSLQWSSPSHGGSFYYTAEINVKFEVSNRVKVKLECGGITVGKYDTAL
jgi:hypothetical protein